MGKVGSCGWKLWTEAEQTLGWEDKPSRVSQQQVEEEENKTKQNLYLWGFGKVACGQT